VTEQSIDNLLSINAELKAENDQLKNNKPVNTEELESTSRELEKAHSLIKAAGAWMDKNWSSQYDILPSWARKIIDDSRKLLADGQ
jgi:hypothetical protein